MQPEFRGQFWFLSNYSPYPARLDGAIYPTVEHAFSAAKTLVPSERERIARAVRPGDAKRLGRSVALREDWEQVKRPIMRILLASKFTLTHDLIWKLDATGGELLIETNNWHDQIWGDCTCPQHSEIEGENALGKALMDLRSYFRGEE